MKNILKKGLEHLEIGSLSDNTLTRQLLFVDELLRWNQKINLTAITGAEEIIEKHLLDSLVLLPRLASVNRVIDVGSGAGFPVIPLAIAMPDKQFYSVDSVGKKIHFQKQVKRLLELQNLEIHCGRIEDLDGVLGGWTGMDVVLARAVGSLDFLLGAAAPFLRPEGVLLAMKGPDGEEELRGLSAAWNKSYRLPQNAIRYQLPLSGAHRSLVEFVRRP